MPSRIASHPATKLGQEPEESVKEPEGVCAGRVTGRVGLRVAPDGAE
jgi:hypothetical protein